MAKLFTKEQLPHFHSTRDSRDRLDLVTENVPVGATRLKADRIIYHPGDTCAKHYHIGSHHLFVILEGEGLYFNGEKSYRLKPGMVLTLEPGMTFSPGRMMVHEENIVIREGGAELLTLRAPRDMPVVG